MLEAFEEVSEFADAELSALVLTGATSLNPGLPLTENQRSLLLPLMEKREDESSQSVGYTSSSRATASSSSSETLESIVFMGSTVHKLAER